MTGAKGQNMIFIDDRALDCMSVAVGKNASGTGRVLVAHNEDDYVHAKVRHFYVPARDWPEGTLLPAEEGRTRIPQVRHTLGYWWSEIIGQNGGLSTSDTFFNEKGVCVVSDSSCGSRVAAEMGEHPEGGIAYELRRALAERAESARQGFEIAKELIETYGYASAGRIYIIADKDEVFTVQAVQGRLYAAARIPDDAVMVMPNHYTIHRLQDAPETCFAPGLVSLAIERGWYTPETPGDESDFDFAKVYQDPRTWRHEENTLRQKYATEMILGREWDENTEGFPLYVTPGNKLDTAALMHVMSTHYETTRHDVRFGPGFAPHNTPVRRVCTGTTVESIIYELGDEPLLTTAWTAFGRPCELPFIPLHPLAGIPRDLEKQADPFEAALNHLTRQEGATCYESGYWQLMQDFENLLEYRYAECIGRVGAAKAELGAFFRQTLAEFMPGDSPEETEERLRELDENNLRYAADRICALLYYSGLPCAPCIANARITRFTLAQKEGACTAEVEFVCHGTPAEGSLRFGPGRTETHMEHVPAQPGSLECVASDPAKCTVPSWRAVFTFRTPPLEKDGAGQYEFILGGRTLSGRSFAAICLAELDGKGAGEKLSWWTQNPDSVYVAAHRGYSEKYPENTMPAFTAALALGADQIETDVRAASDGQLVLMHDEDVKRTTDGEGRVRDMTLEKFLALDAGAKKDARFAGCQGATLNQLIDLVMNHPFVTLDIELKEYPDDAEPERAYRLADEVIERLKANGLLERSVINTFSGKLQAYIRQKYGSAVRRHEYFPPKHMGCGPDHDYTGAYCCCMFSQNGGVMAEKSEFDEMLACGVQPWAGAGVKDEESTDQALEAGTYLITCNDPARVMAHLKQKNKHR